MVGKRNAVGGNGRDTTGDGHVFTTGSRTYVSRISDSVSLRSTYLLADTHDGRYRSGVTRPNLSYRLDSEPWRRYLRPAPGSTQGTRTAPCWSSSPRRRRSIAGWRWPARRSRSRVSRPASAGWATASGPRPDSPSTSSSARELSAPRSSSARIEAGSETDPLAPDAARDGTFVHQLGAVPSLGVW